VAPLSAKGVTINRRDLFAIPVPSAKLLWADLHTNDSVRINGKPKTEKVYINLTAEGDHAGTPWRCSLDFYYANDESFYCRLVDADDGKVPTGARQHSVVFLPPMSGLAEREYRKEQGEISVLIGEGQTAQVLRNLCWQLHSRADASAWMPLCDHITALFHIRLNAPNYIKERSEFSLTCLERNGVELDLSSSGRGCQQVMLLLTFLLANPGSLLLLDEPDAHLEILRQRDVYNLITEVAAANGSQIVAASHSEVILQEAAERDVVIASSASPTASTHGRGQARSRKRLKAFAWPTTTSLSKRAGCFISKARLTLPSCAAWPYGSHIPQLIYWAIRCPSSTSAATSRRRRVTISMACASPSLTSSDSRSSIDWIGNCTSARH